MLSKELKEITEIIKSVPEFLELIEKDNFEFKPVSKGLTKEGRSLRLGFSTYGLKLYYMLGLWEPLSNKKKNEWCDYINSFQKNTNNLPKNSYIDSELHNFYKSFDIQEMFKDSAKNLIKLLGKKNYDSRNTKFKKAINAETKQAIATLYQVGFKNKEPLEDTFYSENLLNSYLNNLDWSKPWTSGAQFASLCVYSKTQSFDYEPILLKFSEKILDSETGSYFIQKPKHTREVINGAMKIISGLDWLEHEIHHPTKLIDYCLNNKPILEGCDVVDYIYVLYKCSKQTDYKKREINLVLMSLFHEIKLLYSKLDGGFSYFKNKSQTHYYGVPVSKGLQTSDIHGTLLCSWALLMILDLNNKLDTDFNIIKP